MSRKHHATQQPLLWDLSLIYICSQTPPRSSAFSLFSLLSSHFNCARESLSVCQSRSLSLFVDTGNYGRKECPAVWCFGNTDAMDHMGRYGTITRFAIAAVDCTVEKFENETKMSLAVSTNRNVALPPRYIDTHSPCLQFSGKPSPIFGILFEQLPVRVVKDPGMRLNPGEGVETDGVGSTRPPPSTSPPPSVGTRFTLGSERESPESEGSRIPSSGT